MTLKNFIELCNLEEKYCYISIKENSRGFIIKLSSNPNLTLGLEKLESYYNTIVTNVDISKDFLSILIEVI